MSNEMRANESSGKETTESVLAKFWGTPAATTIDEDDISDMMPPFPFPEPNPDEFARSLVRDHWTSFRYCPLNESTAPDTATPKCCCATPVGTMRRCALFEMNLECDRRLCDECSITCIGCKSLVCVECMDDCDTCGKRQCRRCCPQCEACTHSHCCVPMSDCVDCMTQDDTDMDDIYKYCPACTEGKRCSECGEYLCEFHGQQSWQICGRLICFRCLDDEVRCSVHTD